jgi:hypothetical protein
MSALRLLSKYCSILGKISLDQTDDEVGRRGLVLIAACLTGTYNTTDSQEYVNRIDRD